MGNTSTEDSGNGKQFAPLFPEPSENGKSIYAEDIARVSICRQFPGMGGRSRRIKMARSEFQLSNGGTFVINPFATNEDDLEEMFGGGEYYLQPFGHDGARLPCGRTIVLPGAMKAGIEKIYLHQTMFGGMKPDEDGEGEKNVAENSVMTMFQQMLAESNKRADALADQLRAQAVQIHAKPDDSQTEVIRSLRLQIDQLMANHRIELDAKSKTVEEERASLRKAAETAQEEYNAKRRFIENELQQTRATKDAEIQQLRSAREMEVARDRSAHEDEIRRIRDEHRNAISEERKLTDNERQRVSEERKRADELVMEERKKRNSEVEEVQRRMQNRVNDLEREVSDMRVKSTKQLTEVMKENLDLRRDLADTPIPDEPPPPPSANGGSNGTSPNDPLWFRALNTWGPHVAKAAGDFVKTANAEAAKAAANAPVQQQIAPPRYQQQQFQPPPAPAQQFVPQVQPVQPPAQPPVPQVQPAPPAERPAWGPALTFDADGENSTFTDAIEGGGWIADVETEPKTATA